MSGGLENTGLDKRVGSKETDQTEAKSKRENHEDVK